MKSLLGLVSYISQFITNYASLTAPLRKLTHQDVKWKWEEQEIQAFERLKGVLTNTILRPNTTYRRTGRRKSCRPRSNAVSKQTAHIICKQIFDRSRIKILPSRKGNASSCVGSRTLPPLPVYGTQFQVITDHIPLLRIFEKLTPMSARIERWRLRLMPYNCKLVYRPGKDEDNPVDYLSRHPEKANIQTPDTDSQYLNYICTNVVPKAMTLAEVKQATQEDHTLQLLKKAIETQKHEYWSKSELKPFQTCREQFAVLDEVILKGNRLVIPANLVQKAVELARASHQGIVKTKKLIREKVWFPGIDKTVENKVKSCLPCQAAINEGAEKPEPLRMSPLPQGQWQDVSADFLGPLPTGSTSSW